MNEARYELLPYIDEDPSADRLAQVEELIRVELQQTDTAKQHPEVTHTTALNKLSGQSMIGAYLLDVSGEKEQTFLRGGLTGVDLTKYSKLTSDVDETQYDETKLERALAYTQLRNRSLTIMTSYGKNNWLIMNDAIEHQNEVIRAQNTRRREAVTDINRERKRRQLDYKPMDEYLQKRWAQAVRDCVEIGIECAKSQLD